MRAGSLPRVAVGSLLALAVLASASPGASAPSSPASPNGDTNAAPQSEAGQWFQAGAAAFRNGDYRVAGEDFDRAERITPHPDALWNAAQAWERAGELARAANRYQAYLAVATPDAPDRGAATKALAALARRLGRMDVRPAEGASVAVDGEPSDGGAVFVFAGTHDVALTRGDRTTHRMVTVAAGEVQTVAMVDEVHLPVPMPRTSPPPPDVRGERARSGLPPYVIALGSTATLVGAGVVVWQGLETVSAKHAFLDHPTSERLENARAYQTRTNIALGVTGALAALTGLTAIFWVDWRAHQPSRPSVALGIAPGSMTLRMRY